jgi:hypothetical protein
MRAYQFIVGVSLSALEKELNQVANHKDFVGLNQVLHVQGIGFIAVVERMEEQTKIEQVHEVDKSAQPRVSQRRPRKKS